jgi:hypothetical protein
MSSLAANPGGSGVYGQPGQQDDTLGIVNQLKDRELRDFKDKSNFMSDLSFRQEARMRALFDPSGHQGVPQGDQQGQSGQPMNTVMAKDPNAMTGYEKGELGIRQQGLGLEQQKTAQTGKMGEEKLGIQSAQEKLNQQKSDQANAAKQADLQRKVDESSQKFAAIQAELERKTKAGEDTLQAHKDLAAIVEERHAAERAMTQHKMDTQDEQFKKLRTEHDALLKQSQNTKQVKKDAQGNVITTETTKGSAAETVDVVGKDGKKYTIPADKVDDWNKNHQPEGEQ